MPSSYKNLSNRKETALWLCIQNGINLTNLSRNNPQQYKTQKGLKEIGLDNVKSGLENSNNSLENSNSGLENQNSGFENSNSSFNMSKLGN